MKKIGIITFHRADNYGAVLQAVALQRAIIRLGYSCEIVDYDARAISKHYDVIVKTSIVQMIKSLLEYGERKRKKQAFDSFRKKNMILSVPIANEELGMTAEQYDKLVTGSDQVWNYNLTAFDGAYFLDFVQDRRKKLSYAASFGIGEIPVNKLDWYKEKLADFGHISVREKTGVELVKKITGNNATNDVDPVFLLSASDWASIMSARPTKKNYILAYMCDEISASYAKKIADEKGLDLVNIVYYKSYRHTELNVGNCRMDLSPDEFLSYMYYADYVVTGSFHATAFSIIFNKQFMVSIPDKVGSRITDLLDRTGLKKRILSTVSTVAEMELNVDWENVNHTVSTARKNSLKNLQESIEA